MTSLDTMTGQPAPAGAFCGAHPDRNASIVCSRCGDFACAECAGPSPGTLCAACRARPDYATPFALDRDHWTLDAVARHAWAVLKADLGANLAAIWAGYLPGYLITVVPTLGWLLMDRKAMTQLHVRIEIQLATALTGTLASPFFMGVYAYGAALARGLRPRFSTLFSQRNRMLAFAPLAVMQALAMLPAVFLTPAQASDPTLVARNFARMLTSSIPVSLWTWGVHLVIHLATLELVIGPAKNGVEALRTSLSYFGVHPLRVVGNVIGLGIVALFSLSCCLVPGIVGLPFTSLAIITMYLAMRTPPGVAPPPAV